MDEQIKEKLRRWAKEYNVDPGRSGTVPASVHRKERHRNIRLSHFLDLLRTTGTDPAEGKRTACGDGCQSVPLDHEGRL